MKAYTDIEQSKKLTTILPLESADMYYDGFGRLPQGYAYPLICSNSFEYDKPCWSLAALLSILPVTARLLKDGNISNTGDIKYNCECSMINIHKWFDNPVDACVEMVLKLNELKML